MTRKTEKVETSCPAKDYFITNSIEININVYSYISPKSRKQSCWYDFYISMIKLMYFGIVSDGKRPRHLKQWSTMSDKYSLYSFGTNKET